MCIRDSFLPDKAIDLVDEACAMIRTELDSMPAELDEISRRVLQLEIEETALKQEKDKAAKESARQIEEVELCLDLFRRSLRSVGTADRHFFCSL